MAFRVEEIRGLEDLQGLQNAWDLLLPKTPHASYFQSLSWLVVRCQYGAPPERLRVLVISDGPDLIGLMPLCVKIEKTSVGPMRVLTFPLDGWGSFYGPIGPDTELILQAALEYLSQGERDFDVADLRGLAAPASSSDCESVAVEDSSRKTARIGQCLCSEFQRVAMLDLQGDWASYWQSRKELHSRYRNVERCYRRLQEAGAVNYVRYRPQGEAAHDADPRWDLYDACEELASRTWQDGLAEGNTLHHEQVRPFLRDVHLAAVQSGAADLNLLYVDGAPIAFLYGYHYRGYVDLIRVGFDPDWSKLAPGNALWRRAIQDSFERRDRVLDLGPGCLDYKRFWLTRVEASYRLLRYTVSPRSQLLRTGRYLKSWLSRPKEESNRENKARAAARRASESTPPEGTEVWLADCSR